jgi:hypothetical protein
MVLDELSISFESSGSYIDKKNYKGHFILLDLKIQLNLFKSVGFNQEICN